MVAAINRAVNEVLAQPDLRERLAGFGFVPGSGSAQTVADLMREDRERYAEVLERVQVTVN